VGSRAICKQWARQGKCYFLTKRGECQFLHVSHHNDNRFADIPLNDLLVTNVNVDESLNFPFSILFDLSYGYVDYRELRSLLVQLSAAYGMVRAAQKQLLDQVIADSPSSAPPVHCIPRLIFAACDTVSSHAAPPLPSSALPAVHAKFDTRVAGGGSAGVFKWMEGKTIRQLLEEHQHANNWFGVVWETRSVPELLQHFEKSHHDSPQSRSLTSSPPPKAGCEEKGLEAGSGVAPSIRKAIVYLTPDSPICVSELHLHQYSHLIFIIGGVCDGTVLREASYRQISSTSSAVLLSASLPVRHARLKKRCLNIETVAKTLMLVVPSLRSLPQRACNSLDLWVASLQAACPPRFLR